MSKRRSRNQITDRKPTTTAIRSTPPPIRDARIGPAEPQSSARLFLYVLGGVCVLAAIGALANRWADSSSRANPFDARPEWLPSSEEDRLCDQFMWKRRAGDPTANLLLGREAVPPAGEWTEDDAEQFQTDTFLRDPNLHIVTIRRGPVTRGIPSYVFVTQGNVAAPRLSIRKKDGRLSSEQRTMTNADLHVGVHGGKVWGVRSKLRD